MTYRIVAFAQAQHFEILTYLSEYSVALSEAYDSQLNRQLDLYARRPKQMRIRQTVEGFDIRRGYHPKYRTYAFDYTIDTDCLVVLCFVDTRMSQDRQIERLQRGIRTIDKT